MHRQLHRARVPSGQRDGSAYFVLGTGAHGEVAAAGTTSEAVAAKVVPVDVDALARDCPDLRGDTGRVVDVSLDGARHELALGVACANKTFDVVVAWAASTAVPPP